MGKIYIELVRRGDDCGPVVQYANSEKQARLLIEKVMPQVAAGYYYKIVK